jgi:hypothetical protein
LKLRGEENIIDRSLHFKGDEYCVRKWKGVGNDDEDARSWLIDGWTYHEGSK